MHVILENLVTCKTHKDTFILCVENENKKYKKNIQKESNEKRIRKEVEGGMGGGQGLEIINTMEREGAMGQEAGGRQGILCNS